MGATTAVLIALLCVMCCVVSSSVVSAVMIIDTGPVEEDEEGFVDEVDPKPFDGEKIFLVEEEKKPEKKEKFKLIRNVDYGTTDIFHYHPEPDNPVYKFDKDKCLNDCALDDTCKAVVFDNSMTRCWAKQMADFEMPLHFPQVGKLTYVKKGQYEDAVKKYS